MLKYRKILQNILRTIFFVCLYCSSVLYLSAAVNLNRELSFDLAYGRVFLIEFNESLNSNFFISKPDLVETFLISKVNDYADKNILAICAKQDKGDLEIFIDLDKNSYRFKVSLTKSTQSEDISFLEETNIIYEDKKVFEKSSVVPLKTNSMFWDMILCSNPDLIQLERLYGIEHKKFFKSLMLKVSEKKDFNYGDLIVSTGKSIYKIPFEVKELSKKKEKKSYEFTKSIYLD